MSEEDLGPRSGKVEISKKWVVFQKELEFFLVK